MPSDETRRLLKIFGVAVTSYEDLIQYSASTEEINKAGTEALDRLAEIKNHIEGLRARPKTGS